MFFDPSFINIALLSVIEIYADFALRFYAQTDKLLYLLNGVLGYTGVLYFLIRSLRANNVLYVNGLWDGMSGLIESVAAYVILGDRLKNGQQYLGLLFVVVGIALMKLA